MKITLFVGILFSSFAILITKIMQPSKEVMILIFYTIVLSSVASGLAIYYEFYLKPNNHMKKIEKIIKDVEISKKTLKKNYNYYNSLIFSRDQILTLLENCIEKIEKKIEKIEKQVMDKSKC
ncbi:MAG: hypothetical protein N3D75_03955 [Candidatus Aenigmarchaeota archaeon]|nr:hypothetical protein [Candidatus Aenigmarchaeota archaeon]